MSFSQGLKKSLFQWRPLGNYILELKNQPKSKRILPLFDEFAHSSTVLACDAGTAKRYGEIKNRLKEKGQPIPENCIWVAAIAQQHGLGLVTKDVHFEAIENLMVQSF